MIRILGIETSCDETSAAVVEDGRTILSNVIASQIEIHARYGGVFPEVASRAHVEAVVPIAERALADAHVSLGDVDAIAVTRGPGLAGSLLVGVNFAKGLSLGRNLPLLGINHIESHLYAVWLGEDAKEPVFPALALIVSGGHSEIILMSGHGQYQRLGGTIDDAAGEAFDKVAKMLGLAYPGGPVIDRLAERGNPLAVAFGEVRTKGEVAFSFSGYKTAARVYAQRSGIEPLAHPDDPPSSALLDLVAAFRYAVVRELVRRTRQAIQAERPRALVLAGGVAANRLLRAEFTRLADTHGLALSIPPPRYCADNAAMIVKAALPRLLAGEDGTEGLDATAHLPLGGPEATRRTRRHR